MDRDRKPGNFAIFAIDMVATVDAQQHPAFALDRARKDLAGNGFHGDGVIMPVREPAHRGQDRPVRRRRRASP